MTLVAGGEGAYTTTAAMIAAIEGCRQGAGISFPLAGEDLIAAGVSHSLVTRTLRSMRLLDLLQDGGMPTNFLVDIVTVTTEEYPNALKRWLHHAYEPILRQVDPEQASQEAIMHAFRHFEPTGQGRAMAALLQGLWRYANGSDEPSVVPVRRSLPSRLAAFEAQRAQQEAASAAARRHAAAAAAGRSDLPAGLLGLLQQIPRGGDGWTRRRREEFLHAFAAVLDFTVPIVRNDEEGGC
jgi:hypothetical protein